MTGERAGRRGRGWVLVALFVACALLSTCWLVVGVVAASGRNLPPSQLVPDTAFAALGLGLGGALLVRGRRHPPTVLLGTALAASAAAFSLQSTTASEVLASATGFERVDAVPRLLLPAVTCLTCVLALAWAPRGGPLGRPRPWMVAAVAGVATAALSGAAFLPDSLRCVLLAGLVLPLLGIVGLRQQIRASTSERLREPARLLFGLQVATVALGAALAVDIVVVASLSQQGLAVVDWTTVDLSTPSPAQGPMVLWYWASRLSLPIVAVAVLMTGRGSGAVSAQRWFSRVLVVALVTASIGCLYVIVDFLAARFVFGGRPAPPTFTLAAAVAVSALAFLPAFLLTERAADRLLYGTRPTPYRVLAELAARPRVTTGGLPDLAGVAEAVGQGLGATTCRLTVHRPGLRDRSYWWVRPGEREAETSLEVPVRHAEQEVGTIAVDRAAVAGADDQRQDLLVAIANSLGVVLQAVRTGIDLERQLRAAVAHAAEIADARRRVVAEADGERRRIERDLHDGAQHHLVSLSLALGLAEHEVGAGRPEQARARLDQILGQLDTAEAVLARTATGLSSTVLAERGVVAALRDELGKDPHIRLDTDLTVARFSPEVEAAVYFCCLESVNNARKHAGGAPICVRLHRAGDSFRFSVEDEGRGMDPAARPGSLGRGVRNMTARMAAVGGHLAVRSTPGEGTRVEGWVPLSDPDTAPAAPGAVPAPRPLEEVRTMVRQARDLYHGTAYAQSLSTLTRRLGEPPTIAMAGPSPATVDHVRRHLDEALHGPGPLRDRVGWSGRGGAAPQETAVLVPIPCRASPPPTGPVPPAERLVPDPMAPPCADAVVLLVPSTAREGGCYADLLAITALLRPSQVLGVLVTEQNAGEEGRVEAPAELRRSCVTVLPAADAVGWDDSEQQRAYDDLAYLVRTRLEARLEAFRARAAMEALTTLLRRSPPPRDGDPLLYELDRFRLGWHELTELDLLDQLAAADPRLPPAERLAAERLLGLHGTDPGARLGCGPEADPGQLVRAAREHLAHWQQVAAHPASSTGTRTVARSLVGTCERLLTATAGQ